MKKRILSIITTLALCLSLLPAVSTTASAADTGKAIQLGTGGISGWDSTTGYDYIYMGNWTAPDENTTSGPIKWRVLDDQTNTGGSGLFLLSDVLLGTGSFGGLYFDNSERDNSAWQGSSAQAWCKDFAGIEGISVTDAFTAGELGAVLATTKSDGAFTSSTESVQFDASDDILNGDKVFFLSAEEAENELYGFTDNNARVANYGTSAGTWWLRSPCYLASFLAGAVENIGSVYCYSVGDYVWAARPAFNLDPDSVLFTSAADNSGHSANFAAPTDYSGNEWKLTLKDGNNFATGASVAGTTALVAGYAETTFTVTHKALSSFTDAGYTDVTAMLTDESGELLYYGSINSDTSATSSSVTIPAGQPLGEYTLSVYGEDLNGEMMTDYATGTPFTTTITVKWPSTVTAEPTAMQNLTYTGKAQDLVSAGAAEGGTMHYALSTDDVTVPTDGWNTTIPQETNAGTYYVWYKVAGYEDHYDSAPKCLPVTIGKAALHATVLPMATAIEYGQTLTAATLTGSKVVSTITGDEVQGTWSWEDNSVRPTATGTHTAIFTLGDTDNYQALSNQNISLTVNPATPTITVTVQTTQVTGYNATVSATAENPHDPSFTEGLPTDFTFSYSTDNGTNWMPIDGDIFTVATEGEVLVKAETEAVDGKYLEGSGQTAVTFSNKNDVSDQLTLNLGDASGFTYGSSIYVTPVGSFNGTPDDNSGKWTYTYILNGVEKDNLDGHRYNGGEGNLPAGEYAVRGLYIDDANIGTVEATFEITKKEITITAKPQTITYGGSIQTGVDQVDVLGLVTPDGLTGITLTADATDAGDHPEAIIPSAAVISLSADNYTITYASGTLTIEKAASSVAAAPTPRTGLVYNGEAQDLITVGSAIGGEMQYSADGSNWDTNIPTGTNADLYTVWYKVVGDANHNDTDPVEIPSIAIGRASLTVTADNQSAIVGADQPVLTYTVTGLQGGDQLTTEPTLSCTSDMNTAGEYPITISGAEQNSGNYTITLVDGKLTVSNKTPVTIGGVTAQNSTYNGSAQQGYTGTPTGYSGELEITYTGRGGTSYNSTTAPTNAGDYTVTFKVPGSDATHIGSKSLDFSIAKAILIVTADNQSAIVGAAQPELTYTVTGLQGGDQLTTEPALSCTPDMDTAGVYTITISGAEQNSGNYNITHVNGTLTVSNKTTPTLTLTPSSTSLTGGGTVTLTVGGLPTGGSVTITCDNTTYNPTGSGTTWSVTLPNSTAAYVFTASFAGDATHNSATATCTVNATRYTAPSGGGGGGYTPPSTPSTESITVPISGDDNTVHVGASVSGDKATVKDVDLSRLDTVIGDHVEDVGTVTIDFSNLDSNKPIATVEIPSNVVKHIAEAVNDPTNDAHSFEVVLSNGLSIEFDAVALGEKTAQADGLDITISIENAKDAKPNQKQEAALNGRPAYEISVTSGGKHISDIGGQITVHAPYELQDGEHPKGIIVWYVDEDGKRERCETSYDSVKKRVNWKTDHLSLYMIDYDPVLAETCNGVTNCPSTAFTDLDTGAWYHEATDYVIENGMMAGYGETFGPNDSITRGQIATTLWRMENSPVVNYLMTYEDVDQEQYYAEAIRWATSEGIVAGYGNGKFGPDDPITRQQLATMIYRYEQYKGGGFTGLWAFRLEFNDVADLSDYAYEPMCWCVMNGIMGGYGNGYLGPNDGATRAQAAAMLMRYCELPDKA